MLVAFAMTNYACFRDRQELSMEAAVRSPKDDTYAFDTGIRRFPRLNRVSAIYGPNGSGKSRFVQGLDFAQTFVVGSSRESQSGEKIRHVPFLFDSETKGQPTTFETCFVQDGTAYEYGFAVDRTRVTRSGCWRGPPAGACGGSSNGPSTPKQERTGGSSGPRCEGTRSSGERALDPTRCSFHRGPAQQRHLSAGGRLVPKSTGAGIGRAPFQLHDREHQGDRELQATNPLIAQGC